MVIRILMFFLSALSLHAIPTNNVDAEVQWNAIYENTPFTVTLSVTHDEQDKIDPQSFTAGKQKINPTFIKNVKMSVSSPLEISIYEIQMQGMAQGLQILPTFSVKIKDKVYSSTPSGYEVKGRNGTLSPSNSRPQVQSGAPTLKLQPIFTGTNPLYPGQRFFLGYRYLYNTNIDLSEERLPLLEAKGFKKIGDKQIDNGEELGQSMTQVIQKVESDTPGVYTFEPSEIVGYAYVLDKSGQKQYQKTPIVAKLPASSIEVLAFPALNKPASFRGAIGSFTFQVKRVGSNTVQVGDKIQLEMTITGTGELEQLLPPDLCCQPGFSGFFKQSDLPPVAQVSGNAKTFLVDLYVENPDVKTIPPIEFSFFNPTIKTYEKVSSEKIPLNVTQPNAVLPILEENTPTLIEESSSSSSASFALTHNVSIPLMLLALFGFSASVFQAHFFKTKQELALLKKPVLSQIFYNQALSNEAEFYSLAAKALHQKLAEGSTQNSETIKALLDKIENTRFSSESLFDKSTILKELNQVFLT